MAKHIAIENARQLWQKCINESTGITHHDAPATSQPLRLIQSLRKPMAPYQAMDLEVANIKPAYFAEMESGNLQLYGPGAVSATINHDWAPQNVALIHTVGFHFVVFENIAHLLGKITNTFPNIEAAWFKCAYLTSLDQLNALGEIPGLKHLTIEKDGNPIVQLSLWRSYAIYRLSPAIVTINGSLVTEEERKEADKFFGRLGFSANVLRPNYRSFSVRGKQKMNERQKDSQMAAEVKMKSALSYNPDFVNSAPGCKSAASKIVQKKIESADKSMKKRIVFQRLWPSIYTGLVTDAVETFDIERHMKLSMQSFVKRYKLASC